MKRRDLLKRLGLLGVGSLLLRSRAADALGRAIESAALRPTADCWLTPEETEGPFYFDPDLIRQNITEGKTGAPLHLDLTVLGSDCAPLQGVLVDLWHADKDGLYSGYSQPGGNTIGQTFLRGSQATDAEGKVAFDTIYPGWYPGRATHIHFKVRLSATTDATSQFALPEGVNDAVYATALYSARGSNPTSNAEDGVFQSAAPQYLLLAVTEDGSGGYIGTFTIGVDAVVPTRHGSWGKLKELFR